MPNPPVGLQPVLGITFSFLSLWSEQAMPVFLLLPWRKINAELTGWTPTGELGIRKINFSFVAVVRPGNDSVSAAPPEKN